MEHWDDATDTCPTVQTSIKSDGKVGHCTSPQVEQSAMCSV